MGKAAAGRSKKIQIESLKNFQQLSVFTDALKKNFDPAAVCSTWLDSRRLLSLVDYLSLYLFAMLNPVVDSMRGACAISHLKKVQQKVCRRAVSLGSFSEAQQLVDHELLEKVLRVLWARLPEAARPEKLKGRAFKIIDSSVWRVCERLSWARWRAETGGGNTCSDAAVRMHLVFDLTRAAPEQATLTKAKICERRQWKDLAQPGSIYIGDRYYGYSYDLLAEMMQRGVDFVIRARIDAQWVVEEEIALSAEDRAEEVVWSGWVRLGVKGDGPRVRVVQVLGQIESILILTSLPEKDFSAAEIRLLYKSRWEIEYFFRWLKCVLGNRHWFCESRKGLQLQTYLALIAAVLLMLMTGKRPNKRAMELIQLYFQGWAEADEIGPLLKKYCK